MRFYGGVRQKFSLGGSDMEPETAVSTVIRHDSWSVAERETVQ